MTANNKDTIYIDIDEEITGIIDKVRSSSGKIVALVLPKRASVLQSIVNMKLLKRSADEAKKHLVLITSEVGLMPLAGAVGLHVAKTPQSKPEIPMAPVLDDGLEETIDEVDPENFSPVAAAARPVGELAALTPAANADDDMETLELDDDEEAALATAAVAAPVAAAKLKKDKKNHKLAVPNFERFRLFMVLGVLGIILLVVGLVFATKVLPKAQIAVTTNASNVNVGLDLTLSTAAKTVDADAGTIPAKLVQQQKSYTQQAPATGQKNNGTKATGEVTISIKNCEEDAVSIPAGTGLSSNGQTFITQSRVDLESVKKGGRCITTDSSSNQDVKVVAAGSGAQFNIPAGNFTVAQSSNGSYDAAHLSAQSSDPMTGGSDNIVKIVTQSDIDAAKQKISASDSTVKQDLRKQLEQDGLTAIAATFVAGEPATTASAEVGAAADNVTITQAITYTMFGIKQSDLKPLVDADVKEQIDTSKQSILNQGLDDAVYKITNASASGAEVSVQTVATAGPDLSTDKILAQVTGKKGGDIKKLLQETPGVTDVQVKLSPFWVTSVPKKTDKITVTIAKPTPASNADK